MVLDNNSTRLPVSHFHATSGHVTAYLSRNMRRHHSRDDTTGPRTVHFDQALGTLHTLPMDRETLSSDRDNFISDRNVIGPTTPMGMQKLLDELWALREENERLKLVYEPDPSPVSKLPFTSQVFYKVEQGL